MRVENECSGALLRLSDFLIFSVRRFFVPGLRGKFRASFPMSVVFGSGYFLKHPEFDRI
jgi:hypothetical protein